MKISSIIDSILWLVVRFFKKADDPRLKYDKAKKENSDIVGKGDADRLNRKLDELTDRLPDNGESHSV